MSYNYAQGFYNIKNPEKYIKERILVKVEKNITKTRKWERQLREDGKQDEPFYRSSWEQRIFTWADLNINVKRWGSENIVIIYTLNEYSKQYQKYITKEHKYFTDIYFEIVNKEGNLIKYLVEVKPKKQTIKPKEPLKKSKKAMIRYNAEIAIWNKNNAKWIAASKFCQANGIIFKVLTETDIFKI